KNTSDFNLLTTDADPAHAEGAPHVRDGIMFVVLICATDERESLRVRLEAQRLPSSASRAVRELEPRGRRRVSEYSSSFISYIGDHLVAADRHHLSKYRLRTRALIGCIWLIRKGLACR